MMSRIYVVIGAHPLLSILKAESLARFSNISTKPISHLLNLSPQKRRMMQYITKVACVAQGLADANLTLFLSVPRRCWLKI